MRSSVSRYRERKSQKHEIRLYSRQKEVHSELSLIYFRIMRELAMGNDVPFEEIDEANNRLTLPTELASISEKLMTSAQRKSKAIRLTLKMKDYYSNAMFIYRPTGTLQKI